MPAILKALVTVFSSDIERAARFYGGLLGLAESYRFPRSGAPLHIEYAVGGTTIAISAPEGLASHGMPPATSGHPFEIGLKTDDVDALVDLLRAAGTTILRDPFDSPRAIEWPMSPIRTGRGSRSTTTCRSPRSNPSGARIPPIPRIVLRM